jgi:hypothetical protein
MGSVVTVSTPALTSRCPAAPTSGRDSSSVDTARECMAHGLGSAHGWLVLSTLGADYAEGTFFSLRPACCRPSGFPSVSIVAAAQEADGTVARGISRPCLSRVTSAMGTGGFSFSDRLGLGGTGMCGESPREDRADRVFHTPEHARPGSPESLLLHAASQSAAHAGRAGSIIPKVI